MFMTTVKSGMAGPQSRVPNSAADPDLSTSRVRFKEKNRTAQKRYRERQKSKLQDSEEKVAELTEQLNALKVEKVRRPQ